MGTTRRQFLRQTGSAAMVSSMASLGLWPRRTVAQESGKKLATRKLGSTGFETTEIGMGCMNMRDPALVNAALDAGINYLDTAWVYMRGRNEEVVGQVMKDRRDGIFLSTKALVREPGAVATQIEESLKRLNTDHVDMLHFHAIDDVERVQNEEYLRAFETVKKQGKTRFIGVSTHSNQEKVIDATVATEIYDAVLVGYNYFSPAGVGKAIERARKAGLATIGMKNLLNPATRPWAELDDIRTPEQKTEGVTAGQALIAWALENPYLDTTVPGVTSFEQLDDDVAVMGMDLSFGNRDELRRFGEGISPHYCRGVAGCTGCDDQCPNGLCVRDINRCLAYANGYGDPDLAREQYETLPADRNLTACGDCDECTVRCVHGLDLTANIRQAKELFA
jgi:uncharacterized protein